MNKYCFKTCKHSGYCNLDEEKTVSCTNSDAEVDAVFGTERGSIFGMTSKEIVAKQGRPGQDLKK